MPKPPITHVIDTMYEMYEDHPETELEYTTPFQLLIAVIMSAQTTDKQVNVVTKKLYQVVKTPQDVLDLGLDQLGEYIRFVGLRKAKAKNIMKTSEILVEKGNLKSEIGNQIIEHASQFDDILSSGGIEGSHNYHSGTNTTLSSSAFKNHGVKNIGSLPNGQHFRSDAEQMGAYYGYAIPDTLQDITTLPGVGTKTAKVVLAVLYGQAWIAVDTHVDRVSKRLGWIRGDVSPDIVSRRLEKKIPNESKRKAHRSIIYFGRYHCMAKNPQCSTCPFKNRCPEGKRRLKDVNNKNK